MTRSHQHDSSPKPLGIVEAPLQLTEELCAKLRERMAKVREPSSGGIAKSLRLRSGMSIPQLSFAADIGESELLAFEESGNVRDLEVPIWESVDSGFEAEGAAIDRLVRVLEPAADEEEQLRVDLSDEVAYLADTLGNLLFLNVTPSLAPTTVTPRRVGSPAA